MYGIGCYVSYWVITVAATIWVAHMLHKNGRVFLMDAFQGNEDLANSISRLLVVGFCLISFGYATQQTLNTGVANNLLQAAEVVADRAAPGLVLLGVMSFISVFILSRVAKRQPTEGSSR